MWAAQVTLGTENHFPHHFGVCCSAQLSLQIPLKKEQMRAGPNPRPTHLCTCESVQESPSKAKCPAASLGNCSAVKLGFALTEMNPNSPRWITENEHGSSMVFMYTYSELFLWNKKNPSKHVTVQLY